LNVVWYVATSTPFRDFKYRNVWNTINRAELTNQEASTIMRIVVFKIPAVHAVLASPLDGVVVVLNRTGEIELAVSNGAQANCATNQGRDMCGPHKPQFGSEVK
jgi:hypothetical protein